LVMQKSGALVQMQIWIKTGPRQRTLSFGEVWPMKEWLC
jgi:hypothetical protein